MSTLFRRKQRQTQFPEPYRATPLEWLVCVVAVLFFCWVR